MIRLATVALTAAALALGACSSAPVTHTLPGTPTGAPAPVKMLVTSADFEDGGAMPASSLADAFGGQCSGGNESPQLSWDGAPGNTAAFALTIVDIDAGDFVHAATADVPTGVDSIATGAWDDAGVVGATGARGIGYFGPCPPSGVHRYVFTVHALDAPLGLAEGFSYVELAAALDEHEIGAGSITGTVDAG